MATRSRKRLPGLRSGSLVRADSLRWRKADSSPWSPLHRRRLRDRPWRLVRIRVPAGQTNSFTGGTDGSNPLSSSGESTANLIFGDERQDEALVPGRADVVMQTALALGFRIEVPLVPMAWRPFGNWRNYLPRAPGFL